jgi:riboflavin synthase
MPRYPLGVFTGLVEAVGTVGAVQRVPGGLSAAVRCALDELRTGDSVAVDGVCLTVESVLPDGFSATLGPETLAVTALADLAPGRRVHLERAMRLSDRLGGHLVLGHVDGVGRVARLDRRPDGLGAWIDGPEALARYVAPKGCIALDGVSLTVNEVRGASFRVDLVPHTLAVTRLGAWEVGDRVHMEVDVVARYTERLIGGRS